MSIATNSKYPRLGIRSEVRSTYIDDIVQNVHADLNTLENQIASASIATTNSETTSARPYHTDLKGRLDTIGKGQASYVEGFAVTAQSVPNMTVQVASGTGSVDGIEINKTTTTNTGTITAPVSNPRWDVVYIDNTNTIGVATGSESANPVYPTIAVTRKPLAVMYMTVGMTTITNSIITDARSWGAYYFQDGQYKWKWKAQDAIDDLDNTIGGHIKLIGNFYENINLTGNNNTVLDGYEAKVYRISSTNSAIMSVNTVGNETTGNKIYGFRCFGNSKAGSLPLYEFDYTDQFVISDCVGDGNGSSSATGKDIEVNNCDDFKVDSCKLDSHDFASNNTDAIVDIVGEVFTRGYGVNTGSLAANSVAGGNTSSGSYTSIASITNYDLFGTTNIEFTLYRGVAAGTAFGRIYVNGIAVGTERSTSSTTPVTYNEDIPIKIGDLVALYQKQSGGTQSVSDYLQIETDKYFR